MATSSDAALLLLALLASATASGAVTACERFGLFSFGGFSYRHLSAFGDLTFRAPPEVDAAPEAASLRHPFAVVLRDLIDDCRLGDEDPPGTVPLEIGVHRVGDPTSWISLASGTLVDGGALLVNAIYSSGGQHVPDTPAASLSTSARVRADIIKSIADFLGPLEQPPNSKRSAPALDTIRANSAQFQTA